MNFINENKEPDEMEKEPLKDADLLPGEGDLFKTFKAIQEYIAEVDQELREVEVGLRKLMRRAH